MPSRPARSTALRRRHAGDSTKLPRGSSARPPAAPAPCRRSPSPSISRGRARRPRRAEHPGGRPPLVQEPLRHRRPTQTRPAVDARNRRRLRAGRRSQPQRSGRRDAAAEHGTACSCHSLTVRSRRAATLPAADRRPPRGSRLQMTSSRKQTSDPAQGRRATRESRRRRQTDWSCPLVDGPRVRRATVPACGVSRYSRS